MTSNQLAFVRLLEDQRSNRENERIQSERNAIDWQKLYETQQNNAISQALERSRLEEVARHDVAQEQFQLYQQRMNARETHRANVESEKIRQEQNQISWAQQQESERHNLASEYAQEHATQVRQWDVEAQSTYRQAQLEETARHNWAQEQESARHNKYAEGQEWASMAVRVFEDLIDVAFGRKSGKK